MKRFLVTCERASVGGTVEVREIIEARSMTSALNKFRKSHRSGKKAYYSTPYAYVYNG